MSGRYSLHKDGGMSYVTYMIVNENLYSNFVVGYLAFHFADIHILVIHCLFFCLMWEIHLTISYDVMYDV